MTHTKPTIDGMTSAHMRFRYLSEYQPLARTQRHAKMYGGAERACALAAENPMFAMICARQMARIASSSRAIRAARPPRILCCGSAFFASCHSPLAG